MESSLRLFKALPVDDIKGSFAPHMDRELASETLKSGFVFAPEVTAQYQHYHLISFINQIYGRNPDELNSSFHKSFATVRDTPLHLLVAQQLLHYATTYGNWGTGEMYVPAEKLEIPEVKDGIKVVVIRGLTKAELKLELARLLGSGIALAEQTVKDALDIAMYVGFTEADVQQVANKEVKVALYDHLGVVPANPSEFLRFLVYAATGDTLLIKNNELIDKLKGRENHDLVKYFNQYEKAYGLGNLAAVFYRFKPIFLALRTNTTLKQKVNRIRRLAPKNHRPMPEDLLNNLTAKINRREKVGLGELGDALQGVNTYRKIRLANALLTRATEPTSALYKVRNGKSYAKAVTPMEDRANTFSLAAGMVTNAIAEDIAPAVNGKVILIPEDLTYALPATEKQYTGNLPSGTYVDVESNLIAGVHWYNADGPRGGKGTIQTDLDLSMANMSGKLGWDGAYRGGDVFYSGDMTDAPYPNGSSEVFHIGAGARGAWLMSVNHYNRGYGDSEPEVPFKIVVGFSGPRDIAKNYVVDPNNIKAAASSVMNTKEKNIGIIIAKEEHTRFYFSESTFKNGISARHTAASEHALQASVASLESALTLNEALTLAGAKLVTEGECDIDLSPETVDKTTILGLLSSQG